MIDINKGISDLEESFGRRLTDEEKFNITLFGGLMNTFWTNTKQNDSDPKPETLPKEEIKPMDIGEVIDGLDYCLSTGKCIGCANSDGRMVATCRPLVENALRLLKEQNNTIDKLRRHNASLISNGIQDAMHKEEIVSNTLKNARMKVENNLNTSYIAENHDHESLQYMYYCKGIRDACWAIDKLIDGYQRHEISEETT